MTDTAVQSARAAQPTAKNTFQMAPLLKGARARREGWRPGIELYFSSYAGRGGNVPMLMQSGGRGGDLPYNLGTAMADVIATDWTYTYPDRVQKAGHK